MQVSITAISSNRKTGPITTTVTERESCPTTCPFYDKGCYAKYGPAAIHWKKVSNHERGVEWNEFLTKIEQIVKPGRLWRHNVSGDLPHNNGNIDYLALKGLINANKGRKGFTYTHHVLNDHNIICLQNSNALGFTVNASTESVEVADKIMSDHGIPAVSVVPSTESRRFFNTESGRKVIVCPATIHDNVNCESCGLCQRADREFIIAFPSHGPGKNKVNAVVTV